ncbi:MAG: hypothetical protein U9Q61_02970 [Thermodesulfobacteriota bacterium]|nr:hypothetical protein [Thermodesulfobacteriota bacterium]
MLIPVIYPNGKHDLVKDFMLSRLIDDQGVLKFKRSDGWVNVSADSIRTGSSISPYRGEERRQSELEAAETIDIF